MKSIEKNTVESKNQLAQSEVFSTIGNPGAPVRVLVLGNSILRHGPKADIGWFHDFGMAASAVGRDFFHLLAEALGSDVFMAARQCAEWERNYAAEGILDDFSDCERFRADIAVFRLGENVCITGSEQEFSEALRSFADNLTAPEGEWIFTTCFWENERVDARIRGEAKRRCAPLVELNDLGESEENKAIGLFAHEGVANHPGDLGMRRIADRILGELVPVVERIKKRKGR